MIPNDFDDIYIEDEEADECTFIYVTELPENEGSLWECWVCYSLTRNRDRHAGHHGMKAVTP